MNKENKIVTTQGKDDTDLTLTVNDDSYFAVTLQTHEIIDEKAFNKFIKSVERIVRSSPEYNTLMGYFKNALNFSSCAVLNNLSIEEVSIELHHSPYTLYNIVSIIIRSFEVRGLPYTTFKIAEEVIKLHYRNLVGLIPLSKTMHELAHNGLFLHKDLHIGLVDKFFNLYKEYMNEDQISIYTRWVENSERNEDLKHSSPIFFDEGARQIYLNSITDVNEDTTPQIQNQSDDDEDYPEIEGIQSV